MLSTPALYFFHEILTKQSFRAAFPHIRSGIRAAFPYV